jgi:solute carrier family 45 protein 1/2/4
MVAIGHLIGYAIGSVDMVKIFGTALGDTQFKQMTVIAALSLIFSVLVTCYAVKERVLISVRSVLLWAPFPFFPSDGWTSCRDSDRKAGAIKILTQLFETTFNLPPRIRAICWVQFWSWIGECRRPSLAMSGC